jgi:hypothetical protein
MMEQLLGFFRSLLRIDIGKEGSNILRRGTVPMTSSEIRRRNSASSVAGETERFSRTSWALISSSIQLLTGGEPCSVASEKYGTSTDRLADIPR